MNRVILFFTLFFLHNVSFSQGTLNQTIRLIDNQGKPMANTPIVLIETTTKERLVQNTDAAGKTVFTISSGKEWAVNILKIKNYRKIKIPEAGTANGSSTIPYDWEYWERTHRKPVDRSKLNIQTVNQVNADQTPSATESVVDLAILRENSTPLKNFPVQLTCYALQKTFITRTNANGHAYFRVPIKNEYEVDIDGVNSFTYIDIGPQAGLSKLEFTYIPTTIQETMKNDTVTQVMGTTNSGTSGRTFANFAVTCSDCGKLTDETIYLEDIYSHVVYKSKLDANGKAAFLLPIKTKYMIHFSYQSDVDVVDLTEIRGISQFEMTVHYQPVPQLKYLEQYLESPAGMMVKDFQEFLDKQYPAPKDGAPLGMFLQWYNPKVNAQSKEAVLEIGFTVPDKMPADNTSVLNVSFVIDRSGSMEGHEKIDAVKTAMLKYVPTLRRTDIVSMISFSDSYAIAVPVQKMGDGAYMRDMIEDLQAGGGTEIYTALEKGYEQVLQNFSAKSVNRVVLLTDGMDSHPVDQTLEMSKKYNDKGIELSCVGVGNGYNHALLSQLATRGGGLLHLTGDAKDMDKIFASEMASILHPVAKDVTVEIEYNSKIVYKQLYGFPSKQESKNKVSMQLDHIYRGLNTLALVKFDLADPTQEIEDQPVTVRLSYFDFAKNAKVTVMEQARLQWSAETGKLELVAEAQKKKMYAIAVANQSLLAMAEAFNQQDYVALKKAVDDAKRQLKDLFPVADDKDIAGLIHSMEKYSVAVARVVKNKKP